MCLWKGWGRRLWVVCVWRWVCELMPRGHRCDGVAAAGGSAGGGLVVLSNMQWFYGATWAPKNACGDDRRSNRRHRQQQLQQLRHANGRCTPWSDLQARQLELIEVLRRNVVHAAVAEVHVLVGESAPVQRYLSRLPWYERVGRCKLHLIETQRRPGFRDYMAQLSGPLLGRTVVFTNQDVLLADGPWASLPTALPPRTAFFLSRYHTRYTYDTQHSSAVGVAEGLFNASLSRPTHRRVCDMTTSRFAVWRRSLCTPSNFGSYDAYVLRVERRLSEAELDLFDYPQNAWGGENVFLYLVRAALGMTAANPCLSLQTFHVHCELPTEFGVIKVGDRRLGKKEIIERARSKLLRLGKVEAASPEYINGAGTLRLNVTFMPHA